MPGTTTVAGQVWERGKLERLCRYISRPAVSEKCLSLTSAGNIREQVKIPCSDGTTHVIFEQLHLISKLASLVPTPRGNLTPCYGIFAPSSKHRILVTPSRRDKGGHKDRGSTWAQRLKRVFNIDVSTCSECGGEAKVIACIEDQAVIDKILAHLMKKGALPLPTELLPATRTPPDSDWFAQRWVFTLLYRHSSRRMGCLVGYCLN